jgi:hypothetical protein
MNKHLGTAAFGVGLIAVAWVGAGYAASHPLALAMTALILAFYLMGALELRRFHQATASLAAALAVMPAPLPDLGDWLAKIPTALQNPVRLRIEGERSGLPGPAMTPYLVGLLVLLGMLGTFLGMVVTLNGAVMALESTTDLPAIRAALSAPVKGLGLAFGTSVAGVAASAVLGLLSALCRRERGRAAQLLDSRIATVLRPFSLAHQRQQAYQALQVQGQALPAVLEQLQAVMLQLAQQQQDANAQMRSRQDSFHHNIQLVYTELAASVDSSLKHSLIENARMATATIQPVVETTMAGLARETTALQAHLAELVTQHLAGLTARFEGSAGRVSDAWTAALAKQERNSDALAGNLQQTLQAFNETFGQRSASLLSAVQANHAAWQGDLRRSAAALAQETTSLHEKISATVQRQLDGVAAGFTDTSARVSASWQNALDQQGRSSEDLRRSAQTSMATFEAHLDQRAAALLASVDQTQARVQAERAAQDQQQRVALTRVLESMATALQHEWQQAGAATLSQQQALCETLDRTAREISMQAQVQARSTTAEIAELLQAAALAPRAAAQAIALLREKLSDSLARDNQLLEERSRTMVTLNTLLDAVNHASGAQRGAIDALVQSSASLLDRAGSQFSTRIGQESIRMDTAAAQVSASAVEVASLGESFGLAVQLFSQSNDKLMGQLQRIESAMGKSLVRSDEQLAYYVAQAREIIDLSLLSQKQIVDDLQRLSPRASVDGARV